jgi:hypothetical protein
MAASSFTVVNDPSGRVVHVLITGDIGAPDEAGGMRDTLVDVGLGESAEPVIVDLQRATLSPHPAARDILRERITRWATHGIPERRVAFVATGAEMRAASEAMAALLTARGYPSAVFEDLATARAWIEDAG